MRLATLDNAQRALHSHLHMEGVSFEAATAFARRYVETIEWKP